MSVKKKYISLIAKFTEDGRVLPSAILWEDGRTFSIDQITDIRKAASLKAGGIGVRYTCLVLGKQVFLYKDEDRWFMEIKDK